MHVPRARFAPVKTTDDLLVVRSDAYALRDDGAMAPTFEGPGPLVALDPAHFKLLEGFERRFAHGPPSLVRCARLVVEGDVRFGAGVAVEGDVTVRGPAHVPDGAELRG